MLGAPDFVFPRERVALFVDGCFWHGCPRHTRIPKSRSEFWVPKLRRNRVRDRKVTRYLRARGWRVIRVWECALGKPRSAGIIKRIAKAIKEEAEHSP
jgi:DNA mismatch endonuclease (patch repair protein)